MAEPIPLSESREYMLTELERILKENFPDAWRVDDSKFSRLCVRFGTTGLALIEVVVTGGGIDMIPPEQQARARVHAEVLAKRYGLDDDAVQ